MSIINIVMVLVAVGIVMTFLLRQVKRVALIVGIYVIVCTVGVSNIAKVLEDYNISVSNNRIIYTIAGEKGEVDVDLIKGITAEIKENDVKVQIELEGIGKQGLTVNKILYYTVIKDKLSNINGVEYLEIKE